MILTRRFQEDYFDKEIFKNIYIDKDIDIDKEIEILILDRNERDEPLHLAILCKE